MDWSQPCQCTEPGWCPRYREQFGVNRWKLCQTRPDYRAAWGEKFDAGHMGHCRHGRPRRSCTLCTAAIPLGETDPEGPPRQLERSCTPAGHELEVLHYAGRYLPSSHYLWPAALTLAEAVASAELPAGTKVIDLGCGTGLVGLAALAAGLDVTFADSDPGALELAAENAARNQLAGYRLLQLDWRDAPAETWDAVFASDVLDDEDPPDAAVAALVSWIDAAWNRTAPCWIADPGREGSRALWNGLQGATLPACIEEVGDGGRSCWLWRIGSEPAGDCRAPASIPLPEPIRDVAIAPCRHRGSEPLRLEPCPPCGPTVRLKVLACAVHGECTLRKPLPGIACCATCPDYAPAPAESGA